MVVASLQCIAGLSVDGGVDTNQKEIKITEVKEGGAAHKHGFLKVLCTMYMR